MNKSAEQVGKTTKQVGKTTKQVGKTTKQVGKTTKQVGKTTKQVGKTTKQVGKTTKQVGKTTKQVGKSAEKVDKTTRQRKPDKRSSYEYNDKYVKRSHYLFDMITNLLENCNDPEELAAMNRNKQGRPFVYTRSLIAIVSRVRDIIRLPYRSCEGMCEAAMKEGYPDFTTLFRRINTQNVSVKDSLSKTTCENFSINMIPDGTGLTPFTRSEYIRIVHKVRRGFIRLVIMIDRDTQEILSFSITNSSTGEQPVFKGLLEDALRNMDIEPDARRRQVKEQKNHKSKTYPKITMTADGGFDTRKIFSMCRELDITPNIRVQTNSNTKARGVDRARSNVVLEQLGGPDATPMKLASLPESEREANRKEWKKQVDYGLRLAC